MIIYTTIDNGKDDIAIATSFVRAEKHSLVTNVTSNDGKLIRVTNNQLKQIIHPTDLTRATVTDAAGLSKLRTEAEMIRSMQKRYPRSKSVLDPLAAEIERMVQVIESGNLLWNGRLLSMAAYREATAKTAPKTIDLNIDGKGYLGAKLSSFRNGTASIMHAGGVAAIPVDQLSDQQITALNATSEEVNISRLSKLAADQGAQGMDGPGRGGRSDASSSSGSEHRGSRSISGTEQGPSSIGAMPYIETVAALLHGKQKEAARRLARQGRRLQPQSAEDIAARTEEGVAEFMAYDAGALTASHVIDNFGDDTGRQRHRKFMQQLAFTTTAKAAESIKLQMKEHAQKYYRGDIERLHAFAATEAGRTEMMDSLSDTMKSALTHVSFLQETRSRQGVQVEFRAEQAGITALSAAEMFTFHTKFDLLTRMDIAGALQSGNWDKVDLGILGDKATLDSYRQSLQAANARAGGKLGKQLETYNTYAAADPTPVQHLQRNGRARLLRGRCAPHDRAGEATQSLAAEPIDLRGFDQPVCPAAFSQSLRHRRCGPGTPPDRVRSSTK